MITHPRHILVILNLIRQDPLWKLFLLPLEVIPPPQPTLPKTDYIDLNIDMASILAKVNVPVPLSTDIVIFF